MRKLSCDSHLYSEIKIAFFGSILYHPFGTILATLPLEVYSCLDDSCSFRTSIGATKPLAGIKSPSTIYTRSRLCRSSRRTSSRMTSFSGAMSSIVEPSRGITIRGSHARPKGFGLCVMQRNAGNRSLARLSGCFRRMGSGIT